MQDSRPRARIAMKKTAMNPRTTIRTTASRLTIVDCRRACTELAERACPEQAKGIRRLWFKPCEGLPTRRPRLRPRSDITNQRAARLSRLGGRSFSSDINNRREMLTFRAVSIARVFVVHSGRGHRTRFTHSKRGRAALTFRAGSVARAFEVDRALPAPTGGGSANTKSWRIAATARTGSLAQASKVLRPRPARRCEDAYLAAAGAPFASAVADRRGGRTAA